MQNLHKSPLQTIKKCKFYNPRTYSSFDLSQTSSIPLTNLTSKSIQPQKQIDAINHLSTPIEKSAFVAHKTRAENPASANFEFPIPHLPRNNTNSKLIAAAAKGANLPSCSSAAHRLYSSNELHLDYILGTGARE